MPLAAGTRLGNYEIVGPLGAGGMGEVYRAKDTKLDREVAIKVLPPAFAQHPERLARFEREAKILASLDHRNIASIYAVEESSEGKALVMELVKGQTLKGPVPVDTALKYAAQIASALDAAHEKGITHRDLKPANIMLTPDGTIKVLDFGLAAVTQPSQSDGEAGANMVTLTMSPTSAGMIMGTAAYMSPEQARGQTVDRRADIWSFGVVLWEVLTGKQLFGGDTVSDILASVLKEEPNLEQVPVKVRPLLRRCLEKEPKKRLQAIGDWELLLSAGEESVGSERTRRASPVPWIAAAVVLAAVAAVLSFVHFREAAPEPSSFAYTIPPPPNTIVDSFEISPDGRSVVIAARANGQTSLWVRALDSFELRELSGTNGAVRPFWSPDGRFISFTAGPAQKKIPAAGGPTTNVGLAFGVPGGTWNRDGVILLPARSAGIDRVNASGGAPTALLESPLVLANPFFLPDGKRFLYTVTIGPEEKRGIYSASLDSKETRRLLPDNASSVYAPPRPGTSTGHVILGRDGSLVAQPVDGGTLRPAGELIPIAEKANTRPGAFSVSTTGTLLYQNPRSILTKLTFLDRSGKELMAVGEPAGITDFALSPDEKRIVIARGSSAVNTYTGQDLWIYDSEHATASRFTTTVSDSRPVWSPDGTKVAFSSNRAGRTDLYEKPATGAVAERSIYATNDSPKRAYDWTRDGKFLLYVDIVQAGKNRADIFALPAGGGKPLPVIQAEFNQIKPQLSPDNRWLAYASDESGTSEVYIQPFSLEGKPAAQRWQISASGGTDPRWRRDGREFFFLAADQKLMSVAIRPATEKAGAAEFAFDSPQPLFTLPPMNGMLGTTAFRYAVTADGKRFLVLEDSGNAIPTPITVLTNWQAGLKK